MYRNTLVVGSAFVGVTVAISAAMIALGYLNKLIHFLSFVFLVAAAAAFWGVFQSHSITEFAVGVMYATGIALAVLMIRRTVHSSPSKAAKSQHGTDSAVD